jgi:hypothetical protein
MAKFKRYYCLTASNHLQDIVDHHVKDHKAFKSKVKEKTLEGKSFGFIPGDVLTDSNF